VILSVIERHRNRGLPSPVDADVLERASVSPSLIPRTIQALQTLDLITDQGHPTEVLEGIRLAPEAEYKQRLADWLADAYADALAFVDPATATETDVRDAFRKYVPTGQQGRMVSLFIGLFTAAGKMPERARQPTPRKVVNGSPSKSRTIYKTPSNSRQREQQRPSTNARSDFGLPPALAGMVASLAAEAPEWPAERRDQFVAALRSLIDFCFPIGATGAAAAETATDQQ
jgi:hypothetical protein